MEVEEIQTQQGYRGSNEGEEKYPDEEDDGEVKKRSNGSVGGGGGAGGVLDFGRFCGWPSSRIVRVSRASGGKDRHSKVLTSKGLRDRRVRLSVNTAIQFYDLQDRLGFDQPSKAVEWLLNAAASSIAELPSIDTSFQEFTKQQHQQQQQISDEKRSIKGAENGLNTGDLEISGGFDPNHRLQQQNEGLSKSACSSNSETSKGSGGLTLSRSENRVKARERAGGRAAEKEPQPHSHHHDQLRENLNPLSQNASSFTELLNSGMNNHNNNNNGSIHQNNSIDANGNSEANFFGKSSQQWSSTPMGYFATELLSPPSTRTTHGGYSGQINFGEHYQEMHPFPFVVDQFVANNNSNNNSEYNLNFTISSSPSSGLAAYNRGTLQSNSSTPSLSSHFPRLSSTDGSSPPFFIGTVLPPVENNHHHHHFLPLYYGDLKHSDIKGKGKN